MSNLVFVTGDFCSGSTFLYTLFRKTGEYYCLYEPLHERLLEYLIWPLRVYEHHFFVKNYFSEYKRFREIPDLFMPRWGTSGLYLPSTVAEEDLYRYFCYIIGSSFGRRAKVMLKENRITFRLGWLTAKFPYTKIVHIYRDKESQWNSIIRRVQEHLGRKDVGQEDVMFNGFNIATWCEDLKSVFPQLDKIHFETGYDRFCKLWDLSYAENRRYADISVNYNDLIHNFEVTLQRIGDCIGYNFNSESLKQLVIPPEKQKQFTSRRSHLRNRFLYFIDKAGRKYAKVRLKARAFLNNK